MTHATQHERIVGAWAVVKQYLYKYQEHWRHVSGPLGSVILSVVEFGWIPAQAIRWEAGEDALEYDETVPIDCLASEVRRY